MLLPELVGSSKRMKRRQHCSTGLRKFQPAVIGLALCLKVGSWSPLLGSFLTHLPAEGSPDHDLYKIWVGIQWLFAPLSRCAPFSELVAPRPTANGFEERCAAALTQNKLFKNRSKLEQLVTFVNPF